MAIDFKLDIILSMLHILLINGDIAAFKLHTTKVSLFGVAEESYSQNRRDPYVKKPKLIYNILMQYTNGLSYKNNEALTRLGGGWV